MSENPNDLELALYGSLSLLVNQVAQDRRLTPAAVLFHVASRLGRFLVPTRAGDPCLTIAWRSRDWSIGVEWRPGKLPTKLSAEELAAMAERLATDRHAEHTTWKPISIWWWGEQRYALRIALADVQAQSADAPDKVVDAQDSEAGTHEDADGLANDEDAQDKGTLEILYTGEPMSNERWSWLITYVRGLCELHHIVQGLLVVRVAMLRARCNTAVQAFCYLRSASLHNSLEQAVKLLPRLLEIGAVDLLENLLTSLVLQIFGTGWRVRAIPRGGCSDGGEQPLVLARTLVDDVRKYLCGPDSLHRARVLSLVDCIDAVIAPTSAPVGVAADRDDGFAMLARWARVHELSRGLKPDAELRRAADEAWATASAETVPLLVRRLAKPLEDGVPLEHARNWLLLWFCLEILDFERERPAQDTEAWRDLRAELAYALRETLRQDLFGSRVDYFHDSSTLVSAVAHLVVWHATRLLGIPAAYQVDVLMEFIGCDRATQSALEHLQHAADIYIAGHFLLSLQIRRNGKVATAARLFAREDVPDVIAKYRRAFSMAAVFHDVGHILLPPDTPLFDDNVLEDDEVRKVLESRSGTSRNQAILATTICIEQLGLASAEIPTEQRRRGPIYVADPATAEQLVEHFKRQARDGRANHGLLGAWYLHRVCARAERLRNEDATMRDCRMMAVRAILLHDVVTTVINTDDDPIAALLVTCNEVFEWSPLRVATGRAWPRGLQPSGGRTPTRRIDRSIKIHDFARAGADSSNATRFDAMIDAGDGHWPIVQVQLVAPEHLDGPVLRLWLSKAQSMGRIKPGEKTGFAPQLRIRSGLSAALVQCKLHTRVALMDALRDATVLPEIVEWCGSDARFRFVSDDKVRFEEVRLGYLEGQIYDGDIEERLPQIIETVANYLASFERQP